MTTAQAGWIKDSEVSLPASIAGTLHDDCVKNPEADRGIAGKRVEIKFSTLRKSGIFKFQQLRDQNYEYAICLGISPFNAQCWAISKAILLRHVIGMTPRHRDTEGSNTFYLSKLLFPSLA